MQESENLSEQQDDKTENENWFFSPKNSWFLSKRSKVILPGKDSWFVNPLTAAKVVYKASRRKKISLNDVTITITKDPELLQQYYDLRDKEYKDYNGWVEYDGAENDFDRKANIMVAVKDGKVIAGLRVSVPHTGYLSNEVPEKSFTYKEICHSCGIGLEGVKYIEVSAIVLDRKADNVLLSKMLRDIVVYCRSNDIKYMFGVSTQKCNRDYRATLKAIGVASVIVDQIEAPKKSKYNNEPMNPIIAIPKLI